MNKNTLFLPVILAVGGSLLLTGCVVRERTVYRPAPTRTVYVAAPQQEVVVTEAPPPVIVETETIAPGPDFVWIGGAWVWHGRWVWEHGRWDRPPHRGVVWQPHHYEYRNGVHVFIRGGWR